MRQSPIVAFASILCLGIATASAQEPVTAAAVIELEDSTPDFKRIDEISLDMEFESGPQLQDNYASDANPGRLVATHVKSWTGPEYFHRPLLFEDIALERYGQSRRKCLQPLFSATHFWSSAALVPYKFWVDGCHTCRTNLGPHRVGSPMPWIREKYLLR